MKIVCKKYVSKKLINKLLSIIPEKDLSGLKKIELYNSPYKTNSDSAKKHNPGCYTLGFYTDNPVDKEIYLCLWNLKDSSFKDFNRTHNNLYHHFVMNFASTLYHEVGHLVDDISGNLKKTEDLRKILYDSPYKNLYTIPSCEDFAVNYAKKYMVEAEKKGLFDKVNVGDIKYFKVFQEKMIKNFHKYSPKCGVEKRFSHHRIKVITHLVKNKLCKKNKELMFSVKEISDLLVLNEKSKKIVLRNFLFKNFKPVIYESGKKKFYYFKAKDLRKKEFYLKYKDNTIFYNRFNLYKYY